MNSMVIAGRWRRTPYRNAYATDGDPDASTRCAPVRGGPQTRLFPCPRECQPPRLGNKTLAARFALRVRLPSTPRFRESLCSRAEYRLAGRVKERLRSRAPAHRDFG